MLFTAIWKTPKKTAEHILKSGWRLSHRRAVREHLLSVGLRLLPVLGVLKNNYTQWVTNKGSPSKKLRNLHFLLARFQHNVDSIFWSKCGFWFELQRNLKEKRASYMQLYVGLCVYDTPTYNHFCWRTSSYQDYCGSCKVLVLQSAVVV